MVPWSCILTWRGSISDQWGVSPKTRPFHCTLTWLTLAITANVGNSTVQFLVVGVCVRAHPLPYTMKYWLKPLYTHIQRGIYTCVCTCVDMWWGLFYAYMYVCIYMHVSMQDWMYARISEYVVMHMGILCMHICYGCMHGYAYIRVHVCWPMHGHVYMCGNGPFFWSLMGRTRL